MSGFGSGSSSSTGRRGINLSRSQFLEHGNTILSPADQALLDGSNSEADYSSVGGGAAAAGNSIEDDLARFTNVDFTDFDAGTFFDPPAADLSPTAESSSNTNAKHYGANAKRIKMMHHDSSRGQNRQDLDFISGDFTFNPSSAPSQQHFDTSFLSSAHPFAFDTTSAAAFSASFDTLPATQPAQQQQQQQQHQQQIQASSSTQSRRATTSSVTPSKRTSTVAAPTSSSSASPAPASSTTINTATATGADTTTDSLDGDGDGDEDSAQARAAAEEDKRRRNTAASARFRIKKKQREQALEKTAEELKARASELEAKVQQLQTENEWLKGLVMVKREEISAESAGTAVGGTAGGVSEKGKKGKRRIVVVEESSSSSSPSSSEGEKLESSASPEVSSLGEAEGGRGVRIAPLVR